MRIYLIRHGKTPGNQLNRYIGITDEPVLEEDQEQLKKQNYPKAERLFVSPLLRCRQTAACIYPGQEQQVIQNLRECDFGRFENKNWKEMTGDAEYQAWVDSNAKGDDTENLTWQRSPRSSPRTGKLFTWRRRTV